MSFTLRRFAGTAALAVTASALTLPLAAPAHATVSSESSFLVVDTNGDLSYGLYTMPTPTGSQTAVPGYADSPVHDLYQLTTARTGGRVAFVYDTYASATAGTPSNEQIRVLDKGGQLVRIIRSVSPSTAGLFSPALSPNGNTIVWSEVSSAGITLRSADVGTGVTTTLSTSVANAVFADSDTLFGFSTTTGRAVAIPATGGSTTALNIPDAASEVRVAPAGQYVAWTLDKSTPAADVADVQFATLDLATNTVGSATTLATGQNNHSPAWETSALEYVHDDGAGGQGEVHQLNPANPQATDVTVGVTPSLDEQEVGIVEAPDAVAPTTVPTADAAFTLTGTSATVRWALPADTDGDRSGVIISRAGRAPFYEPEGVTSVVDTGLGLGQQYNYTITTVDRSGNQSATGVTRSIRATQALPTFADPTSLTSANASFPVSFAPTASGLFTVDYLLAGTTTWHPWVVSTSGKTRTFGSAATTGVMATTSTPGTSYIFRVKVVDSFGNSTPVVSSGRAVVPFDQTKATLSGGNDVTNTTYAYLGTYRRMSLTTNYAKVTLVGNRLQVIGLRCSSCGSFDVFENGTRIATMSSYTTGTTTYRAVLFTKTYSSVGTHTLIIRPKATSGHPWVMLDAFAARR